MPKLKPTCGKCGEPIPLNRETIGHEGRREQHLPISLREEYPHLHLFPATCPKCHFTHPEITSTNGDEIVRFVARATETRRAQLDTREKINGIPAKMQFQKL